MCTVAYPFLTGERGMSIFISGLIFHEYFKNIKALRYNSNRFSVKVFSRQIIMRTPDECLSVKTTILQLYSHMMQST